MSFKTTILGLPLRHIPPLLIASSMTFGGFFPFFNAERGILGFGLPKRIAISKPAQSMMILSAGRGTAIGIALFTFYARGEYAAMDTMLMASGYLAFVDAWVCWREGVKEKAMVRGGLWVFVGGWGLRGMTGEGRGL